MCDIRKVDLDADACFLIQRYMERGIEDEAKEYVDKEWPIDHRAIHDRACQLFADMKKLWG